MQTNIKLEFDDWQSFVNAASVNTDSCWLNTGAQAIDNMNATWAGTDTLADASRMAVDGSWKTGRDKMTRAIAVTRHQNARAPALRYDVAGERPDIMRAIGGDPMSMTTRRSKLSSRRRVLRVALEAGVNANISAEAIINYGAALLSYVDAIEHDGISVELNLIFSCTESSEAKKQKFQCLCVYKRAGQHLDIDRAAFALANPAVLRRFLFNLLRQQSEFDNDDWRAYGRSAETAPMPGILQIPRCEPTYTDMTEAQAAIEAAFAQYGDAP